MDMKIEITCKETMKPSSPTPNPLRNYKLTILDQFALCATNMRVPLILFYASTTSQNPTQTSFHLKKSLQETLTHFYPLAGRAKDYSYINCNDAGATYIETRVARNMEEVLKEPKLEKLRRLLSINPYENCIQFSVPEFLLIQVNHFSCGGVAIGVCISHAIADASTVGTFVKTWAAISRGNGCDVNGVIIDCTSIFPPINDPQEFGFSLLNDLIDKDSLLKGVVNNRFVFNGSKIAALRRNIGNIIAPCSSNLPTRFEALSALILGALMSVTKDKRSDHVAYVVVNLRKRMNPPLPPHCIGNICQSSQLMSLSKENGIGYNDVARKIRDSVTGITDESVRKFHETGGMFNLVKNSIAAVQKRKANKLVGGVAMFSSWCNFPFYEADFGWKKPTWVTTALSHNRAAIFLDSRYGKGIEVWLGLHPEVMSQFEQNIIEYASFIPTNFFFEENSNQLKTRTNHIGDFAIG